MKNELTQQELYILLGIGNMGALTTQQLSRFLFDAPLIEAFDLGALLAKLKEEGLLKQAVSLQGVVYDLTPEGKEALEACRDQIPAGKNEDIEKKCGEYKELFQLEQNYLAQYTEQANAIIPVFLSIREKEKILFKISVIVPDVPTAKKITKNWMKNAHTAYKAVWESIAEGEPMPDFKSK